MTVRTTSVCVVCGGKLAFPVPHHADYHQTCDGCLHLAALREAYRPRTMQEHESALFWERLVTRRRA